jgi:superfamily II DNA or RNA helicase
MRVLSFFAGTLELRGVPEDAPLVGVPALTWDPRTACWRAEGATYRDVVRALVRAGAPYVDEARRYAELALTSADARVARPYQVEAIEAWKKAGGRGVVVLPTGAGKTHVAERAILEKQRSTLVVTPTLDLVRQWVTALERAFGASASAASGTGAGTPGGIGVVGGGEFSVGPLTVTTYDSAHLHMKDLGNRFGLLVFDECHHLPGPAYQHAAREAIAPFRLGLSATPERADGQHALLDALVGPEIYRRDVGELAGEYLAEYDWVPVEVPLSMMEEAEYRSARATYTAFLRAQGIRMDGPRGFATFLMRAAGSDAGRDALRAYRRQRELALGARGKIAEVERILLEHADARVLVFTEDNAMAHQLSRALLLPVITHETKVRERAAILAGLADGTYLAVVTSKVLNEGVDVPAASVAIVVSGSGSVREHVQRLGRVLRKHGDKRARLYELTTTGTGETFTSERRRAHAAYAGRAPGPEARTPEARTPEDTP